MSKLKCWKIYPGGTQSENGDMFTAIQRPFYTDKFLVTVGDRTKPKTIKRTWETSEEKAHKIVRKYMKDHDSC